MKILMLSVILSFGFASSGFALEVESRSLLPQGGRSPAEAGLESGRYQELSREELRVWEKRHDPEASRETASESKNPPKVKSRD